jgi:hypothetical protein
MGGSPSLAAVMVHPLPLRTVAANISEFPGSFEKAGAFPFAAPYRIPDARLILSISSAASLAAFAGLTLLLTGGEALVHGAALRAYGRQLRRAQAGLAGARVGRRQGRSDDFLQCKSY